MTAPLPAPSWAIEPVGPLHGDVRISGSKNAVSKLMVAALLAVDQAKGLEFDSVVLVEPAGIVAEGSPATGRRALYVAMTRTTRRLHIVHAERLPPELLGADATMTG